MIVITGFMGLPAPNKIKEKIVYRMRNPSTKARISNDEEDPLHALHLQEVFQFNHITLVLSCLLTSSPSPYLSLSLFLFLPLSFSVSPSIPRPLNFFLREINFMIWGLVSCRWVEVGFFVLFLINVFSFFN